MPAGVSPNRGGGRAWAHGTGDGMFELDERTHRLHLGIINDRVAGVDPGEWHLVLL